MAPPDDERRYAFLVDTAEVAALRAAHELVLAGLSRAHRGVLLEVVRDHALVGVRLTPAEVPALARLVVAAERRRSGQVLDELPDAVRVRLQAGVTAVLTWDDQAYAAWSPPVLDEEELTVLDRGWDSIDDLQVYRFTYHSQEVIGGRQAVFRRRGG
jgi:hypothetical protein